MPHITPYPPQKPDGRYRATVRKVGYKVQSKICPTKRDAEKWARDVESKMDSRKWKDPSKHERDTVGSLFEKFRDEVCPTRKGGRWEQVRINKFLREADFMALQIKQLLPDDIRTWRDERVKQINPRSVNREMNLLSSVFAHAMEEWKVVLPGGVNPITEVKRPKDSKIVYRHRRWSHEELTKILEAGGHDASKVPEDGREYVTWALLLGLETAMRPGEFCSTKVKDVHLDQRYIQLHDSKNGEARKVPLSKHAVQICATLTRDKKPNQDLIPITSETLGVYYREIRQKAGLADADLRFYDIKHESISRLSKKFNNVLELSAVTGHKSLQSLKYYYNPEVSELTAKLDA